MTSDQPLEYDFGPVIDEPRVVSPVGYTNHPFSGRREVQRGQPGLVTKTMLIPPKPEPVKVVPLAVRRRHLPLLCQVSHPKNFPISNPAAEAPRGYAFGPVIEHERAVGALKYKNDAHPFTGTESLQKNHPAKRHTRRTTNSNSVAESEYSALRIVQEAVSQEGITSAQATFINDVLMPAAIAFFADVLLVVPVTGKIGRDFFCNSAYSGTDYTKCAMDASSSGGTCGTLVTIPDSHLTGTDQHGGTEWCTSCTTTGSCTGCTTYPNQGGGVSNADYVIYVTAQTAGACPSTQGSGTLAYASKCQDDQYDRPTIGYVNFW